ncbi:MAG TPA: histidine kinase, partial [Chitinophagaceae bacterium]
MRIGVIIILFTNIISGGNIYGQLFKQFAFDSMGIKLYELYTTKEGVTHVTSSIGIWKLKGHQFDGPEVGTGIMYDSKGNPEHQNIKMRNYLAEDSIRSMAQGPDSIFYFVAHDNFFLWRPNGEVGGWGWPPFIFPKTSPVSKIWIDNDDNLFVGTVKDNFYFIEKGAKKSSLFGIDIGADKDSNYTVKNSKLTIKQITLQPSTGIFSFAQDAADKNIIWIGTNRGLFTYNAQTGTSSPVQRVNKTNITITEIYTGENGNIWFSTLEKGMGVYNPAHQACQFYPYKKNKTDELTKFPVKTFCYKSPHQFFVAVMDSLPAIFNTENRTYAFVDDSVFHETANRTTDIKVDKAGNLVLIKGGRFYISNVSESDLLKTSVIPDSAILAPFFRGIRLKGGADLATLDHDPELLKKIVLKYDQNSLIVYYDVNDFSDEKDIQFAWKMDGYTNGWVEMYNINYDSAQFAYMENLKPGKYLLQLKVRVGKKDWRKQMAAMTIIITPPFWQTWWFWAAVIAGIALLVFAVVKWRVTAVRKQERIKAKYEKEALELEARALRAQMNPHFIFNCMNSIKSLIQQKDEDK